ncbi:MAG: FtsX-like permease family protein [Bacteroidota bacterium]
MKRSLTQTIGRSLVFYRRGAVNQIVIVAILAAIITGSLLTGYSVRASLKKTALEKLGNTSVLISSGLRYFDPSLAGRLSAMTGEKAVSIIEAEGYCQNFATGATVLNIKVYGVENDFWAFHGIAATIGPGAVAINARLAEQLNIRAGEEIIIKFWDTDPIPENAPFAPSSESGTSAVMKVDRILQPGDMGNFSLGISQLDPMNVFMNWHEMAGEKGKKPVANRLLVQNTGEEPVKHFEESLSRLLLPSDIGLTVRRSEKTGECEIISDRIFIDSAIVAEITEAMPAASPVITYLGNNFQVAQSSAPYSFVAASGYRDIRPDEILISEWLAGDLVAESGDSLTLTWYDPGYSNRLEEKSMTFIIAGIVPGDHPYADPSLMPDFPGIAGSVTCSDWDAGVPLLIDRIRDKDEEYWNKFRGTPKAYISYETGRKLWSSNFGPATALRFPPEEDQGNIIKQLSGSFDPAKTGFTISDIRKKSSDASGGGTDFSSLFLGLSMFMILSCLILLSMAVSMFFDSRREHVRAYFAIGFRNSQIRHMLISETLIISTTGAILGVLLGCLFNFLVISALNSVWRGAVQTDALSVDINPMSLLTGLISTIFIASLLLIVRTNKFLKNLSVKETGVIRTHSQRLNLAFTLITFISAIVLMIIPIRFPGNSTAFSFISGALLFCALIFALRLYYIWYGEQSARSAGLRKNIARKFYLFNPGHGITPVIFIAAGIFAVIITGANRQVLSDKMLMPSGGTGGFLLWAESAVPVRENLSTAEGRKEFGLDEPDLRDLTIIQANRLPGDDASCLNLNHITAPPVLGIDAGSFISRGSFSFASAIRNSETENSWELLDSNPSGNTIYGIADQTVLEWGLKIRTGDTLIYRAENGQPVNIVICAGMKSSVFQGYLLIGKNDFNRYFPSVPGSSIFLADGNKEESDIYSVALSGRFTRYGMSVMPAPEKLASFFVVTNTYLDVFMILGVLGMILGVTGLGFILLRNFNQRKREFALMMATGYTLTQVRRLIVNDHILILLWGIMTGFTSGLTATLQSLRSGAEMPWSIIAAMAFMIIAAGSMALFISTRSIRTSSLISHLRRE